MFANAIAGTVIDTTFSFGRESAYVWSGILRDPPEGSAISTAEVASTFREARARTSRALPMNTSFPGGILI